MTKQLVTLKCMEHLSGLLCGPQAPISARLMAGRCAYKVVCEWGSQGKVGVAMRVAGRWAGL